MQLKNPHRGQIVLTRDSVIHPPVYASLNAIYNIKYELNADTDKLVLHVPSNLSLNEVFADIREMLQKLTFADVFDRLSFGTCTSIIIKLVSAGVTMADFSGYIFKAVEDILLNYFSELVRKYTADASQGVIAFLNAEFKIAIPQLSVVELSGNAATDAMTCKSTIAKRPNFWGIYIGKLVAIVFAIILIIYLIWGVFS